jgi:hypothetical protein
LLPAVWKLHMPRTNLKQKSAEPCPAYADRLVDLSDGELPHDDRTLVAEHVANCAGCRQELARLNASLACLKRGIAPVQAERWAQPTLRSPARPVAAWAIAAAAAGIVCLAGAWSIAWRSDKQPQAKAPEPMQKPKLSEDEALWHIALIEEQARLEASLALMPRDASYDEQRKQNEQLVAKFQTFAAGTLPGIQ